MAEPRAQSREHEAHDALLARGRRLALATIGWNAVEVVATVSLGIAAGSLALIAFGLDSLVEVFASVVVIWYIAHHHDEVRVRLSLRLVAIAFTLLGCYLLVASTDNLAQHEIADSSPLGRVFIAATIGVMFGLGHSKRSIGRAVESEPIAAEARMSFLDGCLASGVLVALVLNAAWGIWWADPAAAFIVAVFCFSEAASNWREARHMELPPWT